MGRFLYYAPKATGGAAEQIKALGLGHAFPGKKPTVSQTMGSVSGPDGGNGLLFAFGDGTVRYDGKAQTWQKCDGGKWWLGYQTDDPPKPEDLARKGVVAVGYSIPLLDENTWTVPAVKLHDGEQSSTLPMSYGLDEDGNLARTIQPKHASIHEYAATVFDVMRCEFAGEGDAPEVDEDFTFLAAVAGLAHQYRVSMWEVLALRLLDDVARTHICMAMVDWQGYQVVQEARADATKKNEHASTPDGSPSPDGG